MTTSQGALADAASMGRRAGQAFLIHGVPTRNPFDKVTARPELAQAWRHAYLEAAALPRS